jgi:uncharacterized membrane protein
MDFYFNPDAESKSRWLALVSGILLLAAGLYKLYELATSSSVDYLDAVVAACFLLAGLVNVQTGLGLLSKRFLGRSYIKVDKNGIFFKRELKKRLSYSWDEIESISIRRSGIYIAKDGKTHKVPYELLSYKQVRDFQASVTDFSTKLNISAKHDMDDNLETI